jgi:5-methylcytosine-specific restriction endonuclease McrA
MSQSSLASKTAWKDRNKERVLAAERIRRRRKWAEDPVYRARNLARSKANNPPEKRALYTQRPEVKERNRLSAVSWRKAAAEGDPHKRGQRRLYEENRRARKVGTVTTNEWLLVLSLYGEACVYCGSTEAKLTMDHIIPLSLGGLHEATNLAPACHQCNCSKGTRIVAVDSVTRKHVFLSTVDVSPGM